MRELRGKRVLITGGAQGIGLTLAKRFAACGSEVVLADLREDLLGAAVESLGETAAPVRSYPLDVADADAVLASRDRIHAEAGPIDVLVNNAGVVFGGPFLDVPLGKHFATFRVNVEGVVTLTYAFLPDLISRPEAQIVNLSSASGLIGLPFGTTYASSKWAVIGFSESLRLELNEQGHRHVTVTTACPSYVSTGLFDGVKPPMLTRLLTPDRLANQVMRAVKSNRLWVLTPWLVRVTPPLKGILPTWLFDRISGLLGVNAGMTHWRGRD